MLRKKFAVTALFCSVLCGPGVFTPVLADYPVAGVKPYERPLGAPTITQVNKDGAWYTQALQGVEKPYPNSLRFLEDQGNWYTPFNRPGMTAPYDIRHWHK